VVNLWVGLSVLEEEPLEAGDDAQEVRWVPLADLCDLNLVEGLAEFLHDNGYLSVIT